MSKNKDYTPQYNSYGKNYILKVLGDITNKRHSDSLRKALSGLKQVQGWINIRKAQLGK